MALNLDGVFKYSRFDPDRWLLLRLPKDGKPAEEKWLDSSYDWAGAEEAFLSALRLYNWMKKKS